jgi:hypothetical protein
LLPFISCIRKHLQIAIAFVVDVRMFKKLPPHFFQVFGRDPSFLAFMRVMMHVGEFAAGKDRIMLICDEDEQTALTFYRLYRNYKRVWPGMRNRLVGISFTDDRHLFALQAADFVASLIRLETTSRLTKRKYDYKKLFRALAAEPDKHERLWYCGIGTATKENLTEAARLTVAQLEKEKRLLAHQL